MKCFTTLRPSFIPFSHRWRSHSMATLFYRYRIILWPFKLCNQWEREYRCERVHSISNREASEPVVQTHISVPKLLVTIASPSHPHLLASSHPPDPLVKKRSTQVLNIASSQCHFSHIILIFHLNIISTQVSPEIRPSHTQHPIFESSNHPTDLSASLSPSETSLELTWMRNPTKAQTLVKI